MPVMASLDRAVLGLGFVVALALAACASAAPARTARAASVGAPVLVRKHTVADGETAFGIARRYGVSVEALAQANELRDPSRLYVGRVLDIPAPSTATEDAEDETFIQVKRREVSKTTRPRHGDGSTTTERATKTLSNT